MWPVSCVGGCGCVCACVCTLACVWWVSVAASHSLIHLPYFYLSVSGSTLLSSPSFHPSIHCSLPRPGLLRVPSVSSLYPFQRIKDDQRDRQTPSSLSRCGRLKNKQPRRRRSEGRKEKGERGAKSRGIWTFPIWLWDPQGFVHTKARVLLFIQSYSEEPFILRSYIQYISLI